MATKKIEERLKESIRIAEKTFEDDQIKEFQETVSRFNKLVREGIVKERGYNLLSVSDHMSLRKITFNTK